MRTVALLGTCLMLAAFGASAEPHRCPAEIEKDLRNLKQDLRERMCEDIHRFTQKLQHAATQVRSVSLNGTSHLSCAELRSPPFEHMNLSQLIPEAGPQNTRVMFEPLNSLEFRPARLTLVADQEGRVTDWYCG